MTFEDLEKKVLNVNATPFKEICVWYKIINNPNSTTREDVHPHHNLYPCYNGCTGRPNGKTCYRTITNRNDFDNTAVQKYATKMSNRAEVLKDTGYSRFILGDMHADPHFD